uniref:Uncharacterized protein n=1 Tax=Salix viminalis TaxID=40686 RepID=A0A6N2MGA0_SALVM
MNNIIKQAALLRLKLPVRFPARNDSNGRRLSICLHCRLFAFRPLASDRALESVPVDDPQSQGQRGLNAALAATRRSSTASRASSEEALLYKLHPHNIGSLTRRSNYLRRPIVEAISHRKGSSRLKHHLGLPGILKHQVRGNYRTERGVGWFAYAIPLPLAGLEPSHTDNEIDLALVPGLPPTLEPTALVGLLTTHTYRHFSSRTRKRGLLVGRLASSILTLLPLGVLESSSFLSLDVKKGEGIVMQELEEAPLRGGPSFY